MSDTKRRLIAALMDCSGSMVTTKADAEGGLRAFLDEQKAADLALASEGVPNETHVVLGEFNGEYRKVYGPVELAEAPEYTLSPGGSTSLYDAILALVKEIELGQSWMLHKASYGEAVTLMVFSDGEENTSKATAEEVRKVISAKQEEGWQILFVGSNQDAVLEGGKIGISQDRSITYAAANSMATLRSVGANVAHSYMANTSVSFTDADRATAMGNPQ